MNEAGFRETKGGVDLNGKMGFRANSGVTYPEPPMYTGKTLFAQLMDFLPWTTFTRIVERHGGDRYVKSLACTEQFRVMAFAQLTCARTCATSKSASRRGRPSATTWDSGRRSSVRRWPMPTSRETGAYYSAWASAHSGSECFRVSMPNSPSA
jgi:hypothetical protein